MRARLPIHLALSVSLATPLPAWQFTPDPICTIRYDANLSVEITYDGALYAIHLTRAEGWPDAPVFSLRFEGPRGLTISTDRHHIEGTTLTVADRGFGNVLDGVQFNRQAIAVISDLEIAIDLTVAADPVAQFKACPASPMA